MKAQDDRRVVLYTHDRCVESPRVRQWLTDRGVSFDERDVSTDPRAAAELAGTGVFATPLLVVDDQIVVGYRPAALAAAFEARAASST